MITVVAALIEKDGKVLIAKRLEGDAPAANKWEFPGGKIEPGETEMAAIEREIREEFGVEVKATEFITNNICEYPDRTIDLRLYRCKYVSGEFDLIVHSAYNWVTIPELLTYELAPADIPLAEYLNKEVRK